MKRNIIISIVLLLLVGAVAVWGFAADDVGGDADASENTISISVESELIAISNGPESIGRHYVLENDIHLTSEWIPINDFRGTFNGQGHTIHNLYVADYHDYSGLFGTTSMSVIRNITVHIGPQGVYGSVAGGLIGYASQTTVINAHVVGDVEATTISGGLIGKIGILSRTSVQRSSVTGNVTSDDTAGGLIGHIYFNNNHYAGGYLAIDNTFSAGSVRAYNTAGGLIGSIDAHFSLATTIPAVGARIFSSYSASSVYGDSYGAVVGGAIGRHPDAPVHHEVVSINMLFYLTEGNGRSSVFSRLLTPEEMRSEYAFGNSLDFDAIWEFREGENDGFPVLRIPDLENDAPPPIPGPIKISTEEELAAISTGLASVGSRYILENDVYLTGEWTPVNNFQGAFDGQGHAIHNLFVVSHSGSAGLFGSTSRAAIRNVTVRIGPEGVSGSSAGGLIGNANIIHVENAHVIGDVYGNSYAGGLIGFVGEYLRSRVERSSAIGNVTSHRVAGGLIGYALRWSTTSVTRGNSLYIYDSFSAGSVLVYRHNMNNSWIPSYLSAGGFIGNIDTRWIQHSAHISNSYTISSVQVDTDEDEVPIYIGGFIGRHDDSGTGSTPWSINRSFRLTTQDLSWPPDFYINHNYLGTPLTPDQMRSIDSFDGWDFYNVWEFRSGVNNNFPVLRGQDFDDIAEGATIMGSLTLYHNIAVYITVELRKDAADGILVQRHIVHVNPALPETPSFFFNNIAPGTYSLIFSTPGWTSFTLNNVIIPESGEPVPPGTDPRLPARLPIHPGDVNGDGQVNISDLAILLENWMGDYENANFTGSGQVNISDLNFLLQNWMAESVVID